jgi:hypothetical protein
MRTTPSHARLDAYDQDGRAFYICMYPSAVFAEKGRGDALPITRQPKTEARVTGWYVGGHGPVVDRSCAAKGACPATRSQRGI